jgi:hypothetical protein
LLSFLPQPLPRQQPEKRPRKSVIKSVLPQCVCWTFKRNWGGSSGFAGGEKERERERARNGDWSAVLKTYSSKLLYEASAKALLSVY